MFIRGQNFKLSALVPYNLTGSLLLHFTGRWPRAGLLAERTGKPQQGGPLRHGAGQRGAEVPRGMEWRVGGS